MSGLKKYRTKRNFIPRIFKCTRAAAAVEFALIATPLMLALLGLVDYGLMTFEKMELKSATRSGAQLALIGSTTEADVEAAVVGSTHLSIGVGDVTLDQTCECADGTDPLVDCSVACVDGNDLEYYITVTATEVYTPIFIAAKSLTESTTLRINNTIP